MTIDFLTLKIIFLLFPGMLGIIVFQFFIYEKQKLKVPEFILYSIILSLVSYLFQFNKLIIFLSNPNKLDITFEFILSILFISIFLAIVTAHLINKGFFHSFIGTNHTGKYPLIEDILLKTKFYKELRYYATIRQTNTTKVYKGNIVQLNHSQDYTEFFLKEVMVLDRNLITNNLELHSSLVSIYLCLKNSEYSLEFEKEPKDL